MDHGGLQALARRREAARAGVVRRSDCRVGAGIAFALAQLIARCGQAAASADFACMEHEVK
jgi:hypothetical protein